MKVDMSPEAVTARLKLVSQLRRLCLALGKARPVDHPAEPPAVRTRSQRMSVCHSQRMSPSAGDRLAEPPIRNKPIDRGHSSVWAGGAS